MLERYNHEKVTQELEQEAAVALIGPRQVGKTTLAFVIGETRPSVYIDLENPSDRAKLSDPLVYLNYHQDKLVILDEIHRLPDLFNVLRGIIDQGRREGRGTGRFLLLGSASIDLMRQSETLAGRISYVSLGSLHVLEISDPSEILPLWLRGGFPRSFLSNDERSLIWRRNFIRTYLERDVPMFGPRIPAETLQRLWTMLAHHQGGLLNASQLGRNLGVSSPTVQGYLDLLVDLLLLRRLPPFHSNVNKRLVKSPKIYVRDSGLVHALLGIEDFDALLAHPIVGASWEGFVIENLLAAAPDGHRASFYRTSAGAEIDLLLELGRKEGKWAIEIKRSLAPKVRRGFYDALNDVKPTRAFVIYGGNERYPLREGVEAISLMDLMLELSKH
jgi:predicted AAA+ superfamily ATPase